MVQINTSPNCNLNKRNMKERTIYALGFFDGVHRGHQALMETCRALADRQGFQAGVVTFGNHPDTLVQGHTPALLMTASQRERILKVQFHMDTVVTLLFDEQLRSMPWERFLQMLKENYGAAGFVCGDDFRFGHRGQGNAQVLSEYCRAENLPCAVVPEQMVDGRRVSSTYIRSQIESGDMETAVRFLGRPFTIRGKVVHGHQLGRTLGIPTANLRLPEGLVSPRFGVYACLCNVDGVRYPAVTNVGTRPTVNGEGVTVEPWILDFEGDLYDREISLEFYKFLRPEMKFESLSALQAEIRRNAAETREYFAGRMEP